MAVYTKRTGLALTVGIIILSLVALGGLYLVKNQGEQARREEAVKVAEERLKAESEQEVAVDETVTEEVAVEDGTQTDDATAGDTIPATGPTEDVTAAAELPQTGPAQAGAVVVLGAITYAIVTYVRSRRVLL